MPNTRIARLILLAGLALALFAGHAAPVSAQEGEPGASQATSALPPIRHSSDAKLTEQEVRGAGVFFQRCSLCHLAKTTGAGGSKFCCVASLGPNLSGRFKNITPDEEQAFRAIILNAGLRGQRSVRQQLQ